jgi:hypothetical protein
VRTSLTTVFVALLGYVAALLSGLARGLAHPVLARPCRPSTKTAANATAPEGAWSDDATLYGPRSHRLLLSRDGVDDREALATEWRAVGERARIEIAASSRLSMELVTLAAPPTLLMTTNEDALDEIRQAKLCFALARAIDGGAPQPTFIDLPRSVLPPNRHAALATLATSRLASALAEDVSGRMSGKLARRTIDPCIRRALEEISTLAARRATHAWAVTKWCLAEGGDVVRHAFSAAAPLRLREEAERLLDVFGPPIAVEGGWERWGIAGAALARQETANALRDLRERVPCDSQDLRSLERRVEELSIGSRD